MSQTHAPDVDGWLRSTLAAERGVRVAVVGKPGSLVDRLVDRYPQYAGEYDTRRILLQAIDRAEAEGLVAKPKTASHFEAVGWDRRIPRYVTRVLDKALREPAGRVRWHPALAGAEATVGAERRRAEAVNRFLIRRPDTLLPCAPARERSLMVFGSDKALESDTVLRIGGKPLPLSAIGARRIEPHLCAEAPGVSVDGAVGLVVENATTYDTMAEWNRRTLTFGVVVLGDGGRVSGSPGRLLRLAERHGIREWRYFGDIDREGLRIAKDVAAASDRLGGPPVLPLSEAYAWLAEHGETVPSEELRKGTKDAESWPSIREEVGAWLGDAAVLALADRTVVEETLVPQEWLGADVLHAVDRLSRDMPAPFKAFVDDAPVSDGPAN